MLLVFYFVVYCSDIRRRSASIPSLFHIVLLNYLIQVPEKETGVSVDEANYTSELLTYDEAMKQVWGTEKDVLRFAWAVFVQTLEVEATLADQSSVQM